MVTALHGRRRRNSRGNPTAQNEIFKLALNAPDDPESFRISTQTVASEYATRYLEQIGVKPSRSTLDLVHKNIPLTDNCVRTTFRAKGHVTDEVQITVPPVHHKFHLPQVITAHSIAQLGINNQEVGPIRDAPSISGGGSLQSQIPLDEQTGPGLAFKRLASRYLHPFNMDTNLAKQNVERIRSNYRAQHGEESSVPFGGPLTVPDDEDDAMAIAMREELAEELIVTPEVVLTVLTPLEAALADWYKAQAVETLKDRLSKDDFQGTVALLSDDWTLNFFTTAINFLHMEFVDAASHHDMADKGSQSAFAPPAGGRRGRKASTLMTKATALQQYDLGYRLFMEAKMEEIKVANAALEASQRPSTSMLLFTKGSSTSSHYQPPSSAASLARSLFFDSKPSSMTGREADIPPALSTATSIKSALSRVGSETTTGFEAFGSPFAHHRGAAASAASRVFVDAPATPSGRPDAHSPRQGVLLVLPLLSASRSRVMFDLKSQATEASSIGGAGPGIVSGDGDLHLRLSLRGLSTPTASEAGTMQGDADGERVSSRRSMRFLTSAASLSAHTAVTSMLATLDAQDLAKVQQARLFALQKEFAALYKQRRQDRSGMFFVMPILLLFLRLTISMLFSSLYPLWCKTREGMDAVEKMDATLVHLFDPHGYLQRNLSMLQSTPGAVSILSKYPHKGHEPEHTHFADTSPLLRAALSQPGSAQARRLLQQSQKAQSQAPIKTKLSKAQQEALYQELRVMMERPNANLGRKGEPISPAARDSWLGAKSQSR